MYSIKSFFTFTLIGFGLASQALAGGGQIQGNVAVKNTIKNGAGAIAKRDATVGSVVVDGGQVKGNIAIDNSIKNGVGAVSGRDATVGSVVVK